MTTPTPKPGAPQPDNENLVTDQSVEEQLSSLASLDISEHASLYERLLSGLQHDLDRTGRGGQ